jgi:hypothetical protein
LLATSTAKRSVTFAIRPNSAFSSQKNFSDFSNRTMRIARNCFDLKALPDLRQIGV